MKPTPAALGRAALLCLLASAASVRAEQINWSYSWSRTPTEVAADSPGTGKIVLTEESFKEATGSTDIVATNITVESSATASNPDKWTNASYSLTLTLKDDASGEEGTLTFTGQFNGKATADSSNIKNTFTGETTQTIVLGTNEYTVTINTYTAPGPTGSTSTGSIGAHANVTVTSIIQELPEPGTLTLAGLGVGLLLVRRLRARRTAHAGSPSQTL
jgi:hypothetical protein